MDSTANQFSHGHAKMEIKQAHVISSSQGEKGGEWGRETREASGEEGDDGGCHGYKDGGWREGVIHGKDLRGVRGWNDGAGCYSTGEGTELTCSGCWHCCYGLVCGHDPHRPGISVPPQQNPPASSTYIHSRMTERERRGEAGR